MMRWCSIFCFVALACAMPKDFTGKVGHYTVDRTADPIATPTLTLPFIKNGPRSMNVEKRQTSISSTLIPKASVICPPALPSEDAASFGKSGASDFLENFLNTNGVGK